MKGMVNERFARQASGLLRVCCVLLMVVYIAALVLCAMGRMSFTLHGPLGMVQDAIWADMPYQAGAERSGANMRFTLAGTLHVWAGADGLLSFGQKAGLMLIAAVNLVPQIIAYGALAGVFGRVAAGEIFSTGNARGLFVYGAVRFLAALLAPFVSLGVCHMVTALGAGELSIATGQAMMGELMTSLAVLVAAYIIHQGVHLQDEVDHTL